MDEPVSEMKKRLMLNYLLSIVFGHDDGDIDLIRNRLNAPEESGLPKSDIQQVIDSLPVPTRFTALRNKLDQKQAPETEVGDNAETGRTE